VAHLSSNCLESLLQLLTAPLVFLQVENLGQVRIGQALQLLFHAHTRLPQVLAPRLEGLRKPVTTLYPCQRISNVFWVSQHLIQILPYQVIKLLNWNGTGRTFLFTKRGQRQMLAMTDVVGISTSATAAYTSQTALSTTDQGTQKVAVGRVVAASKLLVLSEFGLHSLKLLLANDRGNLSNCYPLLLRRLPMASPIMANGAQR